MSFNSIHDSEHADSFHGANLYNRDRFSAAPPVMAFATSKTVRPPGSVALPGLTRAAVPSIAAPRSRDESITEEASV